jgi:hypothetical protein
MEQLVGNEVFEMGQDFLFHLDVLEYGHPLQQLVD